jgi:hypothetical protein
MRVAWEEMSGEKRLFAELRRLDRHGLRRVLIFVRGLLMTMGDQEAAREAPGDPEVTYRLESVKCGKPNCKTCPHGPYWYGYYREGNQLRSRYIGRELPEDVKNLMR